MIDLKRCDTKRLFFHVPQKASWASKPCQVIDIDQSHNIPVVLNTVAIKVTNISSEVRSRVTVHTIQLLHEQGFRENESCNTLSLNPTESDEVVVPTVVSQ